LIFGLPGESLESFAESFNTLVALEPHEIQVGILKRLKGSPIIRHTEQHKLVFSPNPPFAIVSNSLLTYQDVQDMTRFARYWDLIANSGRFTHSLPLILHDSILALRPFQRFSLLSKSIFGRTGQTHRIALNRLFDLVFTIGIEELQIEQQSLLRAIADDFLESGQKSLPKVLQGQQFKSNKQAQKASSAHRSRQTRHN